MANVVELIGAFASVICFTVLIFLLGLLSKTKLAIRISRDAIGVVRDPSIADEDKERLMREGSLKLFALLGILFLGTGVALFVPIGIIWIAEQAGLISLDGVLRILIRWEFIVAVSVLGIGLYWASIKWLKRGS
jgi:uncharacterized BrkB/YihY/UPF0761 family membrane protein